MALKEKIGNLLPHYSAEAVQNAAVVAGANQDPSQMVSQVSEQRSKLL